MNWVLDRYYYIVNFKVFTRPRVYPIYFTNSNAAKSALKMVIKSPQEKAFYEVLRGKKLKEFHVNYVIKLGTIPQFTKYAYPENKKSHQDRKSYRTLLRRRLRRMGMLTLVKNKYRIGKEKIIKPINNTQIVAKSPTTAAKVIQVERMGLNRYFVILEKELLKKKGFLWKISTIEYNLTNRSFRKRFIKIRRKDLIIPHLLNILNNLYGPNYLDRIRKKGFGNNNQKQGRIPKVSS